MQNVLLCALFAVLAAKTCAAASSQDIHSLVKAIVDGSSSYPVWELELVDKDGRVFTNSQTTRPTLSWQDTNRLSLLWNSFTVISPTHNEAVLSVTLDVLLKPSSQISEWVIDVELVSSTGSEFGLWQASILIHTASGGSEDGELFFPAGIGRGFHNPTGPNSGTSGNVIAAYPSGGASMQYLAITTDESYSNPDSTAEATDAIYVGAHDPNGYIKTFTYTALAEGGVSVLNVTAYPDNAGVKLAPGSKWTLPYPVAVGIVSGVNDAQGSPLWLEASHIYREAFVKGMNAPWVKRKISERVPTWYRDNAVWFNSHWQCNDVFNSTGGAPSTVLEVMSAVAARLEEPSLNFHWYEWGAYPFDTHYPDYFPEKKGYKEVVAELREKHGVHTFPYINGRIFDVNSDSYLNDDGAQYCSKNYASDRLVDGSQKANIPLESYGSNATFCVASPTEPYWQKKVADVAVSLVQDLGSDGVYIDQVGAAPPQQCWDEGMNHTLGGGTYWGHGYDEMLRLAQPQQGEEGVISAPIATEDCAEVYMETLQGNLVLTSFRASLAQGSVYSSSGGGECAQAYKRVVPAFPVVYGGHYIAFGAEWFRSDWGDHDWFCGKLASMFSSGTQMGWMSLVGMTDPADDDKCGPMGVGDLLLAPEHAPATNYLKLLAKARREVVDYLVDGVMSYPPVLSPAPPVHTQGVESKNVKMPLLDYDSVSRSSWRLGGSGGGGDTSVTAMVLLTNNVQHAYEGSASIKLPVNKQDSAAVVSARLMTVSEAGQVSVEKLEQVKVVVEEEKAGGPGVVMVPVYLPARSVLALELSYK